GEYLPLAFAEHFEGVGAALAGEQPGDDRRVDDGLAVAEAAQGVDEAGDVVDAFFKQVADPFGVLLEQPHGVVRLDVLGQDEHPDARVLGPDLPGGDQALVGVCGGHADVDDGRVRPGRADRVQQRGGIAHLAHHVDAGVGEQPRDALAGEHHVLGYDDTHRISARHTVDWISRLPTSAPTRSDSAAKGAARAAPSSSTVTTSRPSSWATVTVARPAPRSTASATASVTVK